jgi:hypothetical protein
MLFLCMILESPALCRGPDVCINGLIYNSNRAEIAQSV